MGDRREDILVAALAVLRDEGYVSLTQPRVAARAGVRQSHITYYFPTRSDLLVAVATKAVEIQLAAVDAALKPASRRATPARVATMVSQAEAARVLLMLACTADTVPEIRGLFETLAAGIVDSSKQMLGALGGTSTGSAPDVVHALAVGLTVINFATGRPDGEARSAAAFRTVLDLLCPPRSQPPGDAP